MTVSFGKQVTIEGSTLEELRTNTDKIGYNFEQITAPKKEVKPQKTHHYPSSERTVKFGQTQGIQVSHDAQNLNPDSYGMVTRVDISNGSNHFSFGPFQSQGQIKDKHRTQVFVGDFNNDNKPDIAILIPNMLSLGDADSPAGPAYKTGAYYLIIHPSK